MEKTIKLTFISSLSKNYGDSWGVDFEEPVRNITGTRISGVIIKSFSTINNSYVYFLRTDALFMTRTMTIFNGKPDLVCFAIPNDGNTFSISRFDDTSRFYNIGMQTVMGLRFSLVDQNGNNVNPLSTDPNFSFTVELEYKINV